MLFDSFQFAASDGKEFPHWQDAIRKWARDLNWRSPGMVPEWAIGILRAAYTANPYWLVAIVMGGLVMITRRSKHSGDTNHPLHNFIDMMIKCGYTNPKQIFLMLTNLKMSRLGASNKDYADDSQEDGWVDGFNYPALAAGYCIAGLTPSDIMEMPDHLGGDPYAPIWPIVTLDLDGVLNTYSGWTGRYQVYPIREKALWFCQRLRDEGFHIAVTTARPDDKIVEIAEWLSEVGLMPLISIVGNRKVPSVFYLDDRADNFHGIFTEELVQYIKSFKPYWETEENHDNPK